MRLGELVFALLVAGSIASPAAARDSGELRCVHDKATPEDAKAAYDATRLGDADAVVDRLEKLVLANIACFDERGLDEHVGEVAGRYIMASLASDHVVLQLDGVPNSLPILNDALAKLTDDRKSHIKTNMPEAAGAWLVQVATAAGLDGDRTRLMQ